jgi:dihydroorotase
VSTAAAVALIARAKADCVAVTAEVAPHHLTFTEEVLEGYDAVFRVNPPLREKSDVEALAEAITVGTIDCVATDHAPHTSSDKEQEFDLAPPGMIGLETAFAAVRTAVPDLPLADLVERFSTAPARILGMSGDFGGPLAEGRPAHLSVLDPDAAWDVTAADLAGRSRNCPWIGRRLRGRVLMTLYRGEVTFDGRGR